jgi:sec-independent protein translocase protein TatA
MPQLGVPELLIILVIVVLIFGVGKLPEVGASLGKAIRGFREETEQKPKEKEEQKKD